MGQVPARTRAFRIPYSPRELAFVILFWLALLLLAFPVGYMTAGDARMALLLAGGGGALLLLYLTPFSLGLKLLVLLTALTFAQQVIGFLAVKESSGLNIGNAILALAVGYWLLTCLRRPKFYKPTSADIWLGLAVIVVPLASILYTATFRSVPGYSLWGEIMYYKRWVTPFICFFIICQCFESKRELRLLVLCVVALTAVAILAGMDETLHFTAWEEIDSRATGILDQANAYANLIALTAPFYFVTLFFLRGRPVLSAVLVGVLACLALSLITTYSRAGYIGFAIAFVGALYVAYRGGGHVPFLGPTLLVGGLAVVTVVVAPQLLDSITKRFEMGSYKHSKRRSQSDYAVLNQYAGDRLDLWAAAIEMTKEDPVFGVGFRVYNRLLPKMHRKGVSNSPHNQYLGALAETGIVGLVTLLGLYWYVLRQVFDAWRRTLARGDVPGQICTGAAFISFVIMLGLGMTSDFLHPSVKTFIFWLLIGAGVKYGLLLKEEEEARPTRAAA